MAATFVFTEQIAPGGASVGSPAAEQARSALSRLEGALGERGLALEDLLRLRLFVRDLDELPAVEAALDERMGSQRPAVSVVEPPPDSAEPGVALTLDAAAAPDAREHRRLGHNSVRLGPWVFVGATTPPAGGAPSSSPPDDPDSADSMTQRIGEGSRALFTYLEELLRAQGAALSDVVKVGGWLSFPMRYYAPLGRVRDALVDRAGLMPASAGVQVARVGAAGELLSLEALAFSPEEGAEHCCAGERAPAPSRLARFYADARAAGGYVFTSGEVPDGRGSTRAQAREVYERLGSHLAAHGASPASVLQQTVFVRHARDGAAVAAAAREFYGADIPPPSTTLLPVADIGFHPGCDVEIELVAASDAPSADAR
jgi:enamine deaminase RidA (YjgF/YER057c/UK114 family)